VEVHWLPDVQGVPFGTVPHESFTQGSPTHWALVAHDWAHPAPASEQRKGAHDTAGAGLQLPIPSHDDPLTASLVVALHEPPAQAVLFGQ